MDLLPVVWLPLFLKPSMRSRDVFQFDSLAPFTPWLAHGVFTRRFNVQREQPHTPRNLKKIRSLLGLAAIVTVRQIHGKKIVCINGSRSAHKTGDALITQTPGIGLLIRMADCQAVFLIDPVTHTIAAIHAGWRGSAQKIISETIHTMKKKFGVKTKNLWATIGPSLGPCCALFTDPAKELPAALHPFITARGTVDFWAATKAECVKSGIPATQVSAAGICTKCTTKDWFSHRGDRVDRQGRCGAVIGLLS